MLRPSTENESVESELKGLNVVILIVAPAGGKDASKPPPAKRRKETKSDSGAAILLPGLKSGLPPGFGTAKHLSPDDPAASEAAASGLRALLGGANSQQETTPQKFKSGGAREFRSKQGEKNLTSRHLSLSADGRGGKTGKTLADVPADPEGEVQGTNMDLNSGAAEEGNEAGEDPRSATATAIPTSATAATPLTEWSLLKRNPVSDVRAPPSGKGYSSGIGSSLALEDRPKLSVKVTQAKGKRPGTASTPRRPAVGSPSENPAGLSSSKGTRDKQLQNGYLSAAGRHLQLNKSVPRLRASKTQADLIPEPRKHFIFFISRCVCECWHHPISGTSSEIHQQPVRGVSQSNFNPLYIPTSGPFGDSMSAAARPKRWGVFR
jgi:hypothetical protein